MSDGNMTQWSETVLRVVSSAARRAARLHIGYAEYEDLQGEGYLWVAKNPDRVQAHIDNKATYLLSVDVYRVMHRYAMKQRYLKDGTQPGDYFLYPLAVIAELLPVVLDGPDATDSSPSDLNGRIRANKPLSERGDRAAMVADVQRAFSSLSEDDKELVRMKYGNGGVTDEVIAEALGKPQQTVNYQYRRALKRMAEFLGGEPWSRRKAMSNAKAQHITKEQE